MPLTPHDVARLAALARIDLSQAELEQLAPQLDAGDVADAVRIVARIPGLDEVLADGRVLRSRAASEAFLISAASRSSGVV